MKEIAASDKELMGSRTRSRKVVWWLITKRLKVNLRNGWYLSCLLATTMILLSTLFVSWKKYQQAVELAAGDRQTRYVQVEFANVYSRLSLGYDIPPTSLGIMSNGISDALGTSATIWGRFGRTEILRRDQDTTILGNSTDIDPTRAVAMIFSFLALFFAHDCINRECVQGTLKLILVRPVHRYKILLAEFLGCFASLAIPLTFHFCVIVLFFHLSGASLQGEDWVRFVLIFALSLCYIALWIQIALLFSALCHEPATSLILGMVVWALTAVLYPNVAGWIPLSTLRDESQLVRLPHHDWSKTSQEAALPLTASETAAAESSWNLRVSQHRVHRLLQSLSPVTAYLHAMEILCHTDAGTYIRFVRRLKEVEKVYRAWQREKLDRYPERDYNYYYDDGPLDIDGLPQPRFEYAKVSQSIMLLGLPVSCQLALALMLAAGTHCAFQRLDVR